MSDQEAGHGHQVTTMHAVRHVFERIPSEQLLGQTPQQFFEKLNAAQAKADGMPGADVRGPHYLYKLFKPHDDVAKGDGTTVLPSYLAPDAQKEHALANPFLGAEQNLTAIRYFLVDELTAAKAAHQRGDTNAEFEHLGKAAHCIEDSYSGAHMLRDPARAGDPEAPIKALLNFTTFGFLPWNTHEGSFDSVPTIASNNDLARATDQAGAAALGKVLAIYVQTADSSDDRATYKAYSDVVHSFFQGDHAVVFDHKDDPGFQQMLSEHHANEASFTPMLPDSSEQNMSVQPDVAKPETSSVDPNSATGNDAITMPPAQNAGPTQDHVATQTNDASANEHQDGTASSSTNDASVASPSTSIPASFQPGDHVTGSASSSTPQDQAAPLFTPGSGDTPAQAPIHHAGSAQSTGDHSAASLAPHSGDASAASSSHDAGAPVPTGDHGGAPATQHSSDARTPPSNQDAVSATSDHIAEASPIPPAGGQWGPAPHNETASAASQPQSATPATGTAHAPNPDAIAHPTGGVHTDVRRVSDEHGHRDYVYGHGGSAGQTAHEHAANPHQPHNWQSQNGADIICPSGTPIYAAFDGRIGDKFGIERGHENDGPQSNHHGNRVTIEGAGNQAFYQHLSGFAPGIQPGASVHKGELIGYSGTGGGIHHVHFALQHGDTDQMLHSAATVTPTSGPAGHHQQHGSLDAPVPLPDHGMAPSSDHMSAATPSAGTDVGPHNGRYLTAQEYRSIAEHQGRELHPEQLVPQHPPVDSHVAAVADPSLQHSTGQHSTDGSVTVDPSSSTGHDSHSTAATHPSHHGATGSHVGQGVDGAVCVDPSSGSHDQHSAATADQSHHQAASYPSGHGTDPAVSVDPSAGSHDHAAAATDPSHDSHGVGHQAGHHGSDSAVSVDPASGSHGSQSAAAIDPSHHHDASVSQAIGLSHGLASTSHHGSTGGDHVAVDPSSAAAHGAHAGAAAGAHHQGVLVDPGANGPDAAAASMPGGHQGGVNVDPSNQHHDHGGAVAVDPSTQHHDHGGSVAVDPSAQHHDGSAAHTADSSHAAAPAAHHSAPPPPTHHDTGAAAHHHDAGAAGHH